MASPVTIRDIKVLTTQPAGSHLIVVKVSTSEPGLYGLGCATFTQRQHAVIAALEKHILPFMLGRDVSRIEETWQMAMVHGYWRNGPVLNNARDGVDMALWDIKGKQAGMPERRRGDAGDHRSRCGPSSVGQPAQGSLKLSTKRNHRRSPKR